MSTADLKKRLAKLEARKKRMRNPNEGLSHFELARRIAFVLTCAVKGRGGNETLEAARSICRLLVGVQSCTSDTAASAIKSELTADASEASPNRKRKT